MKKKKKIIIKIRNIKLENVGKITIAQKFIRMNKFKYFFQKKQNAVDVTCQ